MRKYIFILLLLPLFFSGCGLKRSNPLDPNAHNIDVPNPVTGLTAAPSPANSENHFVRLTWNKLPITNATGYFIYMGKTYNGEYTRVFDFPNSGSSGEATLQWTDNSVVPGDYFYKMSSYRTIHNQRLEGSLSPYVYVRVLH
jgi:hypothetical protein